MRVAPLDADMYVNETFCKLICVAGADISDLAKLACAEFPPTYAGQVAFFVVPDEARARAIQRDPSFANDILLGEPLFASDPVISGSWLLARVPKSNPNDVVLSTATEDFIRAEVNARIGAAVSQAVTKTMADARLIDSFDPFARSHHSDLTSLSSSGDAGGSPMSQTVRRAFKVRVAEFYGLNHSEDPPSLTDMLGVHRNFAKVTLAHIWPDSYKNSAAFAREMALPVDFHLEVRNFLLLPKDVHDAFDDGKIGFIPSRDHITLRVFIHDGLADEIAALNGYHLHLPRTHEGHVPYKRTLGWFAWLAKGATVVSPEVRAELEAAMSASASSGGNDALTALVRKAAVASYKLSM